MFDVNEYENNTVGQSQCGPFGCWNKQTNLLLAK